MKAAIAGAILAAWALAGPSGAETGDIHVYKTAAGQRLFTDLPRKDADLHYLGRFGRPVATASCVGVDQAGLDRRAGRYRDAVRHHAGDHGLDPALALAVMRVESCFDRRAVSRVGARGLMQLMPATARALGVTDSFDAQQNIRGGVRYLARMLKRFDNDRRLALAAYNAGPGAVDRYGGIPPFRETRQYVDRVESFYRRFRES